MKEIDELTFPDDFRYAEDHEWAQKLDGDRIRIGISDYAQDQLGDIVFVEMPEVGTVFEKGQTCGTLESVKAVGELYIPVGGEILSVNEALEDAPGLVNESPYQDGWIIEVKPADLSEWEAMMTRDAYLEMLKGMEK